jgi:hypothetical protein
VVYCILLYTSIATQTGLRFHFIFYKSVSMFGLLNVIHYSPLCNVYLSRLSPLPISLYAAFYRDLALPRRSRSAVVA